MNTMSHSREQYFAITLFGLIGPLTWVFHFALVYLAQQFLCLEAPPGNSVIVTNVISIATGIMSIFLGMFIWRAPSLLNLLIHRGEKRSTVSSNRQSHAGYADSTLHFLNFIIRLLAALSFVAIIWSACAVLVLHECGGPY